MAFTRKDSEKDGNVEVQKAVDAETDLGFRGAKVDPTPNVNYTVAGQLDGKPTPETDEATADKARTATTEADRRASGG